MTQSIAIIGGGISGTFTVLQCLKQCRRSLTILWFDANNQFCKGLAYSTWDDNHLLNVRANNMSVFPDEADHFVNWLTIHSPQYSAKDFVPRKIYGIYVQSAFELLQKANPLVQVKTITKEVHHVERSTAGFVIKNDQNAYQVEKLILALGNFLPAHPRSVSKDFIRSENYFQNAFDPNLIKKALRCTDITIIGSGLTMVDVIVSLAKKNYNGTIRVISPHGYIPQPHTEKPIVSIDPFLEINKPYRLSELLSIVNFQLKKAKKEGYNPHSVIDAMRPFLQKVWLNFTLEEKQQFIRHLRHKWGVARHRAPMESMNVLNSLLSMNQLHLMKGRIYDIQVAAQGFDVSYSDSINKENKFNTSFLINCTGPEADYGRLKSPVVRQMLTDSLIAPDMLKYGLNAKENGQISENLYTLGPPLKGILWESVAVPEIRVQAKEITSKIICD
jgi:uncharacterized NAD(P)/FAD-binding protein YdhS